MDDTYIITTKKGVIDALGYIQNLLSNHRYSNINDSNNIAKYNIENRFASAYQRLKNITNGLIKFRKGLSVGEIVSAWKKFDNSFNGEATSQNKKDYGELIKLTLRFLEYIRVYKNSEVESQEQYTVRSVDINDEKAKLEQIKNKRNAIKSEIEKLERTNPKDEEQIRKLTEQLKILESDYKETQRTITNVNSDNAAEQNMQQRIDDAFKDLATYTKTIEDEKKKVKTEFWIFLITIPVLTILFFCMYFYFMSLLLSKDIVISKWFDYVPYGVMVSAYILLMWMCIYLKNRANKISIELSTRLFNIHYLEGLMKMTNKLSVNTAKAIEKINDTIDRMLDNYQKHIGENHLSEKEISMIEQKELATNPYWKLLQEIKELIKTTQK